jgi:hypothetical protein
VTPAVGTDGISTLRIERPLPTDVEIGTTLSAEGGSGGHLSNAFVIFDYESPTDFKFAGAYVGINKWVIGHRTASDWITDAQSGETINALRDYHVRVVIENDRDVTLYVDDVAKATRSYGDSLTDGWMGLGTENAVSHFDDLLVQQVEQPPEPVPGSLPLQESFDDGLADHFTVRSGSWSVGGGRYQVTPSGGDGISTLLLDGSPPTDLEFRATINADSGSGYQSNAFVIFDYQGPTDFKFAGAKVGLNEWWIGHRDAGGWQEDISLSEVIDSLTDYQLRLVIENDSDVTLQVNGAAKLATNYGESLTDGELGLGTDYAVARYDDVVVQEYVPPPSGTLPLAEDFQDGVADFFEVRSGTWVVDGGRYSVTPAVYTDGISTLGIADTLPPNLEIEATINAEGGSGGYLSNALVIFDYQDPTDFKFAGAYVGINKWSIGHRVASDWITDAQSGETINALTDYQVRVVIENDSDVTLYVDDVAKVTRSYEEPLTDGQLGLGTENAISHFDDVLVREVDTPPGPIPGALPMEESFDDGLADHFEPRSGSWSVGEGRYQVIPAGGDGISTLLLDGSLPANLEFETTINADSAAGYLSNAFVIFDYQGPTDFKFAGAKVGLDRWLIGHRDAAGWQIDSELAEMIAPSTDYRLRLLIENDTDVTLSVDGVAKVAHSYGGSLSDGQVGLGTENAISRYDDVTVQEYVPPPSGTLPVAEDFDDGVADYFEDRSGTWTVGGGRYSVTPVVSTDGISTLRIGDPLPADLEVAATIRGEGGSGGYLSNAFVIFDYQSPTDFKFAGAYVGINKWSIGHRDGSGWISDAKVGETINALTDYQVRVVIENDSNVTLYVDGAAKVTRSYGDSLTDGQVGLGTKNAISHYDDVSVQQYVSAAALSWHGNLTSSSVPRPPLSAAPDLRAFGASPSDPLERTAYEGAVLAVAMNQQSDSAATDEERAVDGALADTVEWLLYGRFD